MRRVALKVSLDMFVKVGLIVALAVSSIMAGQLYPILSLLQFVINVEWVHFMLAYFKIAKLSSNLYCYNYTVSGRLPFAGSIGFNQYFNVSFMSLPHSNS